LGFIGHGKKSCIDNKLVRFFTPIYAPQFLHYNRNIFNRAPCSLAKAKDDGFFQNKKDFFHTQGIGGEDNTKWQLGGHEGIYGKDERRRDDPLNGGTYNYGSGIVTHTSLDVIPYYILGNTPDDPTNFSQRVLRTFNLPVFNGPVPSSNNCACE